MPNKNNESEFDNWDIDDDDVYDDNDADCFCED